MQFTLTIELGNDAMQTYQHIVAAVRDCLSPVRMMQQASGDYQNPREGDGAKIRDVNGNTVGKWEVGDGMWPPLKSAADYTETMEVEDAQDGRIQSNAHLVNQMMQFSRHGALAQMFIIDAIAKFAKAVAETNPDDLARQFGDHPFISSAAWQAVAVEIRAKMNAFYRPTETGAEVGK